MHTSWTLTVRALMAKLFLYQTDSFRNASDCSTPLTENKCWYTCTRAWAYEAMLFNLPQAWYFFPWDIRRTGILSRVGFSALSVSLILLDNEKRCWTRKALFNLRFINFFSFYVIYRQAYKDIGSYYRSASSLLEEMSPSCLPIQRQENSICLMTMACMHSVSRPTCSNCLQWLFVCLTHAVSFPKSCMYETKLCWVCVLVWEISAREG